MASDNQYTEYHGKLVMVIIDSKAQGSSKNVGLELFRKIVNETEDSLNLEDIICEDKRYAGFLCDNKERFLKAKINKDYVIGVFEKSN